MNPKIFFVLLGLLVALALLGVGAGMLQGGDVDEPAATPAWGDRVRELLEQPLQPEDVQAAFPAGCRDQFARGAFTLAPGDSCTLILTDASTNLRTLTLELTEGAATVVMHPGGENQLTSRQTLGGDEDETEADLSIFKEGGTLEIRCGATVPCRVEVAE